MHRIIRAIIRPSVLRLVRPLILVEPDIAGRFNAYDAGKVSFVVPKSAPAPKGNGSNLPIPPIELRISYAETEEGYLNSGREHVSNMLRSLESCNADLQPGSCILDFGCGAGRMTRWLVDWARDGEVWGADIGAERIFWCQRNLSPPLRFLTNTTIPHLPFGDNYFDLVLSRSVFTHITPELADAWLLELRRVLRPEGHLYFTMLDNDSVDLLRHNARFREARAAKLLARAERRLNLRLEKSGFAVVALSRSSIVYDRDFMREKLSSIFEVLRIEPVTYEGLGSTDEPFRGFQTAVVVRKTR